MPAVAAPGQEQQAVGTDTKLGCCPKAARELEDELEREALGIEEPKKTDHVTIDAALELYLGDRAQRGLKDSSKMQRLPGRPRDYAYARDIILLQNVSARMAKNGRNDEGVPAGKTIGFLGYPSDALLPCHAETCAR